MRHLRRFRTYYRLNRTVDEWHMGRIESAVDALRLVRRVRSAQ